jgi:hypothetical protein
MSTLLSHEILAKSAAKISDSKEDAQTIVVTVHVHNATSTFNIEKMADSTNILFLSQYGKRANINLSKGDFEKIYDQFMVKTSMDIKDCQGSIIDSKAFNSSGKILRENQDCFAAKSFSSRNKSELLKRMTSLVR